MSNEDSPSTSPIGMILSAQRDMHNELREHRTLFSEIKESIAEQRQTYAALASSIDNLAGSINRHEHIVEKVLAIESWRTNAKLEERIAALELWKIEENLSQANWRGRFIILSAAATVALSVGAYIVDIIVKTRLLGD